VTHRYQSRALLVCAATFLLSQAASATTDREIAELISQFSDDKKASAALEQVTKIGEPAVDQLVGLALEKQDTAKRGWAIAALGFIGGGKANETLTKLSEDNGENQLVRTWAYAGRVAQVKTLNELIPFGNLMWQFPALKRPVSQKAIALATEGGGKLSAEDLIKLSTNQAQLQQALVPVIISLGPDKLITAMQTSSDQNVRRMAAAYLGNVAQSVGQKEVATKVINALRFSPSARDVPWKNGPLFIPALTYDKETAQQLVGQLVRWYVWCDARGKRAEHNQLHNNLRGVGLARMAGYQSPGWNPVGTDVWLKTWGAVVGKRGIEDILNEQGLLRSGKYRAVLDQLK
jgi:HEAT repeat protein